MKHLLLVSSLLLVASLATASDEEISESYVSEKEKQDFSEGYLNKTQVERENDYQDRLAIIEEHNQYMKEIGRGIHNK